MAVNCRTRDFIASHGLFNLRIGRGSTKLKNLYKTPCGLRLAGLGCANALTFCPSQSDCHRFTKVFFRGAMTRSNLAHGAFAIRFAMGVGNGKSIRSLVA